MIELKQRNISFIEEVLEGFYHIDKVHTISFKEVSENIFEAVFDFKPYSKVIHPLGHISANLIHEAIMEVFYLVVANIIKKSLINGVTFDDFLNQRAYALFREETIKYKKEIFQSSENILYFSLINIKNLKGKFSTVEIKFSGFCEGQAKAVIHSAELVKQTLET